MRFGTISFLASVTPAAVGGSIVVNGGADSPESTWGETLDVVVPVGMLAGDRLVVVLANFGVAATSFSTGTWNNRTPAGWAGTSKELWISDSFGSVPGTLTATFAGDSIHTARTYAVSGLAVGDPVLSSSTGTTGDSALARAHAYTTASTNDAALVVVNFDGGGVSGGTGQDAAHTWLGLGGAYNIVALGVRATAGSYDATVGPASASSISEYWSVILGGA